MRTDRAVRRGLIIAAERQKYHERLIRDFFRDDLRIRSGPFAGMRYLADSCGSALLPKLLGSYEEPVQPWVREILRFNKYQTIIDVGSAEGYYAVGFAWVLKGAEVLAFDTDPKARELVRRLAALNGVEDRVSINTECTYEHFERLGGPETLIFCDIEGAEDELLDPREAPSLCHCDILVESHDFLRAGITERLIRRFSESHRIRIVVDYPGRVGHYPIPDAAALRSDDRFRLMDEWRPSGMRFLYMEPLSAFSAAAAGPHGRSLAASAIAAS